MKKDGFPPTSGGPLTRRTFLQKSSTAAAASALLSAVPERFCYGAAGTETVKVALVGCGGRGTGGAGQALSTEGDVKLVAMADAFRDRLDKAHQTLDAKFKDRSGRVDVPEDHKFVGLDAYKQAIALADVVVLATPPGFRPIQFEEAIKQGKHVFMEKPVATDAPGVRRVLAAAAEAKKKNLKVGVGLQRRHQAGYIEIIKRLQDGAIGDILDARVYWNGGPVGPKARRADLAKQMGREPTEMEYQLRNWYMFVWPCGDHIVEQHIHNIDVINWLKGAYPVRGQGMGGRQFQKGPDSGQIYDHHAVEFEYADGSRMFSYCRQIPGCWSSVSEAAVGTKGATDINKYTITGPNQWRFSGESKDPYQREHDDLFDAIRNNKPYSEAEYGALSTMTAILGRMCTYSGKVIEWDNALNSKIDLMPKTYAWDAEPPVLPDKEGLYPVAEPGKYVAT